MQTITHTSQALIEALLKELRLALGFEHGILSRIEKEAYHVMACDSFNQGITRSDIFNLDQTYCKDTLKKQALLFIKNAQQEAQYNIHPCFESFGLASYLGTRITVGTETYGTLNLSSSKPREQDLSDLEKAYFYSIRRAIQHILSHTESSQTETTFIATQRWWIEAPIMSHLISTKQEILHVNEHWIRKLGYRRDEVIGKKASTLLTPASAKLAELALPDFLKSGWTIDLPYDFICKNGSRLNVLLNGAAYIHEGKRFGVAYLKDLPNIALRGRDSGTFTGHA